MAGGDCHLQAADQAGSPQSQAPQRVLERFAPMVKIQYGRRHKLTFNFD